MGETAPLILIGALSYVAFTPESLMDSFTSLPVQIFNWAGRPQEDFHGLAAAAIIVLIVFLFLLNGLAIMIRSRGQKLKL
jgi:phosphate transport system permease protein